MHRSITYLGILRSPLTFIIVLEIKDFYNKFYHTYTCLVS